MGPFIHVLYIQSADGWYAQCLDYDVGAQGATQEEAEHSFFRTWQLQAQLDRQDGREPFVHLGRAPDKFFEMAKTVEWGTPKDIAPDDDSSRDLSKPPAYMLAASMMKRDSAPPPASHS